MKEVWASDLKDWEFLQLIFNRVVFVHGDNPQSERMKRFHGIIDDLERKIMDDVTKELIDTMDLMIARLEALEERQKKTERLIDQMLNGGRKV